MAEIVKANDLPEKAAYKAKVNKRRAAKAKLETTKQGFAEKVFADLTNQEKDDLLKALAISAGIIEE